MKGGGFGDMGGLVKQAQKMQKQMARLQDELKQKVVEGTSGGGMVKAFVNGQKELLKLKLDPKILDPDDAEMVEDLVLAAISEAMRKADELHKAEMAKVTGGLQLPGMT